MLNAARGGNPDRVIRLISRYYFFLYFFPAENALSTCFPTPK